jgi:hypothetical protein
MTGYVCKRCPLAFEVGYYGYWDLSGGCVKYICRHCGTMHKIEHRQRQPDMLFALAGPIRSMVDVPFETHDGKTYSSLRLPLTEDSWQAVGPLPTADQYLRGLFILPDRAQAVALDHVACAHCGRAGGLLSNEWPLGADGSWPSFGENCPVCKGDLQSVYVACIN